MKTYNAKRERRDTPKGAYVALREYMLASPAWQSLDSNSRCLYVELSRRYKGPNSTNGKIPYSDREAAKALHIGKSTADRCFDALIDRGFIRVARDSGFNIGGRRAREWLLTEHPDDTKTGVLATRDFMRWEPPAETKLSPSPDRASPTAGTPPTLKWDRVANGQR